MESFGALLGEIVKAILSSKLAELVSTLARQIWLVPLLFVLLVWETVILHQQKGLRKKLCIDGKPYYDIMLDLLYLSQHKAKNSCKVDTLEWDFVCDYHPGNPDFLDIKEKWTIHFSANIYTVSALKFGIHGGSPDDLEKESVEAYQDGSPLNLPRPLAITGIDCEAIEFPLISDVERRDSSKLTVSFLWKKFIVVDRKDDYFYFIPKSLANKVDEFHFKVKHPYNCEPAIYLFKRSQISNYIKRHITEENESQYKVSIIKQDPMEFEFTIRGLNALDVVLIIFSKTDLTNSPPPCGQS